MTSKTRFRTARNRYITFFVFFSPSFSRENITKIFNLTKGLIIYDSYVKAKNMFFTADSKWKTGPHNRTHGITPQKTCAVVGSGAILLNSCCGNEIDAHDFVMRSNLPILRGFEADVGTKQNITSLNIAATNTLLKNLEGIKVMPPARRDRATVIQRLRDLKGSILFLPKGGRPIPWFKKVVAASQAMSVQYQVAFSSLSAATYTDR